MGDASESYWESRCKAASAAFRLSVDRAKAVTPPLNGSDRAVLGAIYRQTIGYTKPADQMFLAGVAVHAGMVKADGSPDVSRAAKSLKKLHQAGVILYEPPPKGQRKMSRFALPTLEDDGAGDSGEGS